MLIIAGTAKLYNLFRASFLNIFGEKCSSHTFGFPTSHFKRSGLLIYSIHLWRLVEINCYYYKVYNKKKILIEILNIFFYLIKSFGILKKLKFLVPLEFWQLKTAHLTIFLIKYRNCFELLLQLIRKIFDVQFFYFYFDVS